MDMPQLDRLVQNQLVRRLSAIEAILDADLMAIMGPLVPGLDQRVRIAIEMKKRRRRTLAIILYTEGGVVEVVERMVNTIRHHYGEVVFIVPDRAMSAGTVFVMSGDRILMDYFSCLGPIDPQLQKEDGKLIPALSYLNQFERLCQKAARGELTSAEYALLEKLDLAELHQFEQARDLSVDLLKKWLSAFKFKDWKVTEARKLDVTPELKASRAEEIAKLLSDNEKWHSHGRGISMDTLKAEINLRIDDLSENRELARAVAHYFDLLTDYLFRQNISPFVHTRECF
ncbi:MAG: serine dehydrogenasease [Planctomycetes bacterium]|nr:serine dehydrogenasease [Planctomycetota bacterium]